jgi:hypothetical protein
MTTLYARLLLGDLFIHGIGGAKYDEVTSELMRRLFPIQPPDYVTLSATFLLPIDLPAVDRQHIVRLQRELRDLRYHPEAHLGNGAVADSQVSRWVSEKREWIEQRVPRGQRLARHLGIARANAALQPYVEEKRRHVEHAVGETIAQWRVKQLLGSREWSLCLYRADELRRRLLELFGANP